MKIRSLPYWVATALLVGSQANAVTFESGELKGTFNSQFTLGASWRIEDPDVDIVSPGNARGKGRASSSVVDDGTLNYDTGKMWSMVFKGRHDLDLSWRNFGVFTRFKYWYDYELERSDRLHGNSVNNYALNEPLDDTGYSRLGANKGIALLDLYFYTDFDIGQTPIDLRIGRQVVNWGESTFIQNGVNIINPVDVSALRRPGAELKEALLPVGMIYASAGLTGNLTLEGFYQYEWARTELEGCGTFFSSADVAAQGCDKLTISADLPDRIMANYPLPLGGSIVPGYISRADDDEPSNRGQWGLAMRYFADQLNATEFGFYYTRYHSRVPIFSGVNNKIQAGLPITMIPYAAVNLRPQYTFVFPEGIDLFGASFNTNLGSWSIAGELSYRPNYPLAINTTEISQAVVLGIGAPWSTVSGRALEAGRGGTVEGYDNVKFFQTQVTFAKFFERVMGASRLTFIGEVGVNHIGDLPSTSEQRYGRSPAFGIGEFDPMFGGAISCHQNLVTGTTPNGNRGNCTNDGYVTDWAWGYRMRAIWDYSDVFWGVNLRPSLAWSHDVDGTSPAPNFIEGRKALGVGLGFEYLNRYTMDINWTNYYGGTYNTTKDRDFISLSFGVSF